MFAHLVAMENVSWFPWLLDILLKNMVLLAVAWITSLLCRRASAAQRHLIWTLAVIGVLLLPVLSAVLPAWHVVRLPEWKSSPPRIQSPVALPAQAPLSNQVAAQATPTQVSATQTMPTSSVKSSTPSNLIPVPSSLPTPIISATAKSYIHSLPWSIWVILVWALGTALVLTRWVFGYAITQRILKQARPTPARWNTLFGNLTNMPRLRLLISEHIVMPVVLGITRTTILLPLQAEAWPEERCRVVLLHELAHIQRRDLLAQLFAQFACAIYWMNPLVWLAAYRLRIEREAACDDVVLRANVRASDYAAHLLAVACALPDRRLTPVIGIAMGQTSEVGKRIKGVLNMERNRQMVTKWGVLAAVLIMLTLLVTVAIVQKFETHSVAQKFAQHAAKFQTKRLQMSFSTTILPSEVVISPDGEHVAYVNKSKSGNALVLDGMSKKVAQTIRTPWLHVPESTPGLFFSPNGQRIAYAIMEKPFALPSARTRIFPEWSGRQRLMIDNTAGAWFDELDIPIFSPDSKRYLYVARKGTQWCVVVDGQQGKSYDELGKHERRSFEMSARSINPIHNVAPVFSSDSRHVAYAARTGKQWVVVFDGQEGIPYDKVTGLTFSPDGKHLAYAAYRNNQAYLVNDGQEGPTFDQVWPPVFSPNSQRIAFVAAKGDKNMLVLDGEVVKPDLSVDLNFKFSPDSQHFAYVVCPTRNEQRVVYDGKEGPSYQNIWQLLFSPNSQRLAYVVALNNGKNHLVVDGKEITDAHNLVFSPDSAHVAYTVGTITPTGVIVDNKPASYQKEVTPINFCFTPDSQHFVCVYAGFKIKDGFVTVDGRADDHYQWILCSKSPDNDSSQNDTYIFFDTPNRFHYFAIKDGYIKKIAVTIPPGSSAAKTTMRPVLLSWVDEASGNVLFTNNDIVYFDWNQQLFQLKDGADQSLQSLPKLQQRDFLLKDKEGVIYRGTLYSAISSIGFDGPTIELFGLHEPGGINPPTYKIQAWYGGAVPRGKDQRFNPRLIKVLQASGILILPRGASGSTAN